MSSAVALLSGTEVLVGPLQGPFEPLPSRFVEQYQRRTEAHSKRHAWKQEEREAGLMSASQLWGRAGKSGPSRPRASGLARGLQPMDLVYVLEAGGVQTILQNRWSGAFDEQSEIRLTSNNDRRYCDLSADLAGPRFACTVQRVEGSAHIAVMSGDGRQVVEVTSGDSDDGAPVWHPTRLNCIVYESAGLARDASGDYVGRGPSELMCLEVKSGQLETLHASQEHDLAAPRFDADGNLYCIRRPYKDHAGLPGLGTQIVNAALAPVHVARALGHVLGFFARTYSGKGLKSNHEEAEVQQREALARRRGKDPTALDLRPAERPAIKPWLVPETWELVRFSPGGEVETLATRVLDYDLLPDGGFLRIDGTSLIRHALRGAPEVLAERLDLRRVVALHPQPGPS